MPQTKDRRTCPECHGTGQVSANNDFWPCNAGAQSSSQVTRPVTRRIKTKEDDCPEAIAKALNTQFYYEEGEGWWSGREAGMYYSWIELCVRGINSIDL